MPGRYLSDSTSAIRIARVLLVEDSAIYVERISDLMRDVMEVDLVKVVDTENAAVASIYEWNVDVIILDLHLREGSGFGVMRALAAMPRRPRVIVLTNHDLEEYQTAAVALGASHFLDKARDSHQLPDILRELVRSGPRH